MSKPHTPDTVQGSSPAREGDSALKPRLLLAEDDPALGRAYVRILREAGYDVELAANGREAADRVAHASFDVIVSDVGMPEMDGIALLKAVRLHDVEVPVILVTGAPDVATAAQAVEYGAMQYLTKPVDLGRLEQVVARAVQLRRMVRMKREAFELAGQVHLGPSERGGLEASFAHALEGLWMAYQPIVRSVDRNVFGYEALLRSSEPALPSPPAMLDAAERLDRLPQLGRRIRESAAATIAAAPDCGVVFVNLHPRDLLDEQLVSTTAPLSKVAARVVLEITERASLDNIQDVRGRIANLRALGFRIAIDDLGAGYAGLSSFATLEPDFVKLDMSLVRDIERSSVKQKLVRSMTALCHDMGMLIVAEGVETAAERDLLVALECDFLQGYLLAKPGRPFPSISW